MEKRHIGIFVALVLCLSLIAAACGGGGGGGSTSPTSTTYTVTYNGNGATGGSVPSDPNNYSQGQMVTVLGNPGILVKTGYTFSGWNTLANGTTSMSSVTMGTANVTLYAIWTANGTGGNAVTYNGNGATSGSVPIDSNSYVTGETVTVLGNSGSLVYTGYTFVGWQTTADGSGIIYAPGQTFTKSATNGTLYAFWEGGYAYSANNQCGYGGSVSQYWIGPNGALTPMFTPSVTTGGNDPRNIAVDPLGKYSYVSNQISETVSQFTIGAEGSLTSMSTPTILVGPNVPVGQLYYPASIVVNPSGPWAYVLNIERLDINQYTIGTDGSLTSMTTPTVAAGSGSSYPDSITVHPSGKWAYVPTNNGGYGGSITQYNIDQNTGALTSAPTLSVAAGPAYSEPYAITIEPTKGKYAYVADYEYGYIFQYNIDQNTGALTPMSAPTVTLATATGGYGAASITVDPLGRFAYATVLDPPGIAQFTIDQNTGALTAMTPPTVSLPSVDVITVEASGKYAYATSGDDGSCGPAINNMSIFQFTIDQTTGALTLMNNPTVPTEYGPSQIITVGK